MIVVAHEQGSRELHPLIRKIGLDAEITQLPYGDFMFEGNGPKGRISIGVERKTLHDILACIDDHRYSAHQKVGMKAYDLSYLVVEGVWRPHDPEGWLMELFSSTGKWGYCIPGGRRVLYSKLRRYLFSVALAGVTVMFTRDMFQTAYDVCELYHYFSKAWSNHTAMLETQKIHLPDLNTKPMLVRRWASELEGIGVKHSIEAQRLFKTPIRLARADEMDWMQIPGIGAKTATSIIKEIQGW